MGILTAITNYLNSRSELSRNRNTIMVVYGNIGRMLFKIFSESEFPYMDKYIDFSELCANFGSCTMSQYVYSMRLKRNMTAEECRFLEQYLVRGLANESGIDYRNFAKSYGVKVAGGTVFVYKK